MERGFYHVPSSTNWNGIELTFAFDTDHVAPPGSGYCSHDGSDRFFVNYLDSLGNDVSGLLASVKQFDLIRVYQVDDPTKFVILSVDYTLDQVTRYRFNAAAIFGSVGFDNNANVRISFVTSGYSGYSGRSGYSGSNGSAGVSGYSGYSGIPGDPGTSGFSGYSGYSGSNGATGTSGYSGYSGFSGSAGLSFGEVQRLISINT